MLNFILGKKHCFLPYLPKLWRNVHFSHENTEAILPSPGKGRVLVKEHFPQEKFKWDWQNFLLLKAHYRGSLGYFKCFLCDEVSGLAYCPLWKRKQHVRKYNLLWDKRFLKILLAQLGKKPQTNNLPPPELTPSHFAVLFK